ncbi:hypothetical protein NUW58_g2535 [Xylaria curta]|uniref:Uncharacterized protein n=1 Tax=Xylaria curta TaxID=42375 RepID=A0ACC1PGF4_9PEZI|nr:hypothetical protein NUW58_g2535 [Xylaria curta]
MVTKVEMEMAESQNERDARVEKLWKQLDYQGKGELDWKGLQRGLKKIDHPLKNADEMLKNLTKAVDTDGDGKIQYEEFRVFVQAAERQLFQLFRSIDRDQNGQLDKEELQTAFHKAGLAVPNRRLDEFFADMDHNRDGFISYEEWRNFLLFMPNTDSTATLHTVFTFYSDILTLSSEGDPVMSEKSLEGIVPSDSFLTPSPTSSSSLPESDTHSYSLAPDVPRATDDPDELNLATPHPRARVPDDAITSGVLSSTSNAVRGATPADLSTFQDTQTETATHDKVKKSVLIRYIPDPGYFIAGAIAGGISRTATAPLDRLKVYLLVNTKTDANVALNAAKKGRFVLALKNAGRPFIAAVRDLYKSGGLRGFFAGNGLNVVKIMPETAIRFGAYEAAKNTLAGLEGHNDPQSINPYSKFVAGGAAGMAAQFCVYPLDTLKFRLQSEYVSGGARGNALLFQTARTMLAEGGVRAAYRGVTMGLIGMFPYSAIDMGTFEFLKKNYIQYKARASGCHEEDAQPSTFATGIMGASSGAFGASVVYPLNVLRTRLQTQGTSMHPARYNGIWDVAHKTVKNEGFRGLYKGLMPNLLKVAPALSITWMVLEPDKDRDPELSLFWSENHFWVSGTISSYIYYVQNSDVNFLVDEASRFEVKPAQTIDFERIRTWVDRCRNEHIGGCERLTRTAEYGKLVQDLYPELHLLRFIDVRNQCVVETNVIRPYVALSYVWGLAVNLRLTTSNKADLAEPGALLNHLIPRTIRDAVSLNDPDDVNRGIKSMDLIYENAELTIVAACGHDADAGLPGVREGTRLQPRLSEEILPNVRLGCYLDPEKRMGRSVYNSRAWTFQEEILSTRRLIFIDELVYFRCRSATFFECFDPALDSKIAPWDYMGSIYNSSTLPDAIEMLDPSLDFQTFVMYYTMRSLTNQEDTLNALGGIIQRLSRKMKCGFLEGLPIVIFDLAILFTGTKGSPRRRHNFPSYSWAGWKGTVDYSWFIIDENEWLNTSTWIVWYKRSAHGALSLVWDILANEGFPYNDDKYIGYRKRNPFQPPMPLPFSTGRTQPTEDLGRAIPVLNYPVLQFWTLSARFNLRMINNITGHALIIDRFGTTCGGLSLDDVEGSDFFGSVEPYELIAVSTYQIEMETYPQIGLPIEFEELERLFPSGSYYNVILLMWHDGLAERRGMGYAAQEGFLTKSLSPGVEWKEIILG